MLPCLPLWKACNQQVDYLDKRHCNLLAIPDDILRYTNTLEELLLDANQINELPRGLFRLLQLRKLTLSDNEICRLPPDVANFMHLQELDLSRNDIEDIPENIKYCRNLQVVDLSSNPLQRLPDGFTHLKNLTHLGLNDVSLTRLPTDVGSLSNLESLELRENLIKYLPASLSFLVRLKSLDLGSNMIDELPQFIGSLSSLEELWLDCNEITELPCEIGNLANLTQLDVSENKLEQLPEEIGRLTHLTDLILSQNQIEYLPDGIGNLRRLLILKADQNQLLQLNSNIGNCEFLQELLLMENLLNELPSTVGHLKMLAIFNVDKNHLTNVPREIGNCASMGILSMRDNRVTHLPTELGNLKNLHVLDVCGNRLQHLPITLSTCNLKAIWLSENQVQPLLKFQQDVDDRSGHKILTCFLLPQQAYQPERTEEPIKDGAVPTVPEDWNKDILVTFASDEGDPHAFEESHFVRHNTPHPKELRARHGRLTKKDAVDIYVLPDDPQIPKEDGSNGPVFNNENCCSNESQSSRSSELSAGSKASTVKILSEQPTPIDVQMTSASATYQSLLPSSSPCPSSAAFTPNEAAPPPPSSAFIQAAGSNGLRAGIKELKKLELQEPGHMQVTRQGRESSEKRVEFSFLEKRDEDGGGDDVESRLHRRDTPHHLKNKRIDSSSSTKDVSEEKIHHILAHQAGPNCESFESWASDLPEPVEVDKEFLEEDIDKELPPPPSFEELSMDAVAKQPARLVSSETRITEMHIIREPGVTLGMSIAGGLGSTSSGNYEGVYVSRVAGDGPSSRAGLRAGDRLISINGRNVGNVDHNSVVTMLKESGTRVVLVVARDVEVEEYEEPLVVELCRDENGLGFTIAGGMGSTPYKDNDHSIYVSRITPGGATDKNGNLRVGDRLIAVNGVDVTSVQHDDAVRLLTCGVGRIVLDVRRCRPASPGVASDASDTSELEIVDLTLPYLNSLGLTDHPRGSQFLPLDCFNQQQQQQPSKSAPAAAGDNSAVPPDQSSREREPLSSTCKEAGVDVAAAAAEEPAACRGLQEEPAAAAAAAVLKRQASSSVEDSGSFRRRGILRRLLPAEDDRTPSPDAAEEEEEEEEDSTYEKRFLFSSSQRTGEEDEEEEEEEDYGRLAACYLAAEEVDDGARYHHHHAVTRLIQEDIMRTMQPL